MRPHARQIRRLDHPLAVSAIPLLRRGGRVGVVFEDGEEGGFGEGDGGEGALHGGGDVHRARAGGNGAAVEGAQEVGVDGVGEEEVFCSGGDGGGALVGGRGRGGGGGVEGVEVGAGEEGVGVGEGGEDEGELVVEAAAGDARGVTAGEGGAGEGGAPFEGGFLGECDVDLFVGDELVA